MIINKRKFNFNRYTLPIYLLFGSLLTFSTRGFQEAQENLFNIGNLVRYISLPIFYLYTFYLCYKKKFIYIPKVPKAIKFLLLYWLIGAVSLLGSKWLNYSLVKWVEYFQLFFLSYYVLNMENEHVGFTRDIYEIIIKFFEGLMITVLIGIILSPSKAFYIGSSELSALRSAAIPFRLSGHLIPITSTSVGFLSAILLYIYLVKYDNGEKVKYGKIKIVITTIFVITAQARMAIIGLVLAIIIYYLFLNRNIIRKIIAIYLGVFTLSIAGPTIFSVLLRGQDISQLFSLSGRLEWWNYALEVYKKSTIFEKIFGQGFAGGEKVVAAQSNGAMYTLDSEILGSLISTGILGVIFIVMAIVSLSFAILYLMRNIRLKCVNKYRLYISQLIGIMVILIVRMITTNTFSILSYYSLLFVSCILVVRGILREIKYESRNRKNYNRSI